MFQLFNYHQNTLLDAFHTKSRNAIVRNPSMVIPLLANHDLTPMLIKYLYKDFRGDRMASVMFECD